MKNQTPIKLGGFPNPTVARLLKSPKTGTLYVYTQKTDPKTGKISWSLSKLEKTGIADPNYLPDVTEYME